MTIIKAFTLEQAATVSGISTRRARYWARHGILIPHLLYETSRYPHRFLYDFTDVVGLRTLAMLRDQYGLSLQQLRRAHVYLRQHSDRPWSELRFWVRGKELLFSVPQHQQIVSATRPGQTVIAIEIEPVARSVQRAAEALGQRQAEDIGKTERHRNIQGNRLVVKGTRVPVESIIHLAEDGYTPAAIVQAFPSVTLADVHAILAHQTSPVVA